LNVTITGTLNVYRSFSFHFQLHLNKFQLESKQNAPLPTWSRRRKYVRATGAQDTTQCAGARPTRMLIRSTAATTWYLTSRAALVVLHRRQLAFVTLSLPTENLASFSIRLQLSSRIALLHVGLRT